jgi:hypothetical protein
VYSTKDNKRKEWLENFKIEYGINYNTYQSRRYLKNNPNYISNYLKKYRKTKVYKLYKNSYRKKRRLNDINFAFLENTRKRIWSVLKGYTKTDKTKNILGCSLSEFKNYISSKFVDGMSFDNYGKWHLDHIKPCASFDLTCPVQQLACFHYSNLQPLWAKDNLKKGDKIND